MSYWKVTGVVLVAERLIVNEPVVVPVSPSAMVTSLTLSVGKGLT